MDCPWNHHGLSMDCPWNYHKLSMNYGRPSTVHRPPSTTMDYLWTLHGRSMDPLWTTMDSLWNHHDFFIEPTWAQHGLPWTGPGTIMDRPRKIYGTVHEPTMDCHGLSMDHQGLSIDHHRLPWTVHGLSMDHQALSIDHHGLPSTVHGLFMDHHGPYMELSWTVHRLFTDCAWTTKDCP